MSYYAALVSLIQLLKEINHPEPQHPNSTLLEKHQIYVSLYEKFSHLQKVLEDYSPKDRAAADNLERHIRDASYRAKDIIEFHISDQNIRKTVANVCYYEDLEKVKDEADIIVEELSMRIRESHSHRAREEDLQLNSYISEDGGGGTSRVQAPNGRSTMVGFDEHLTTIKAQLCGESSRREVIPIVGMGGIGKTTLAGNVFDDEYIVYYFDCRAWVTISQDYNLGKVVLDIISSLKVDEILGGTAEDVYKYLKGRRYLIIIDDVWDTNVWDGLKRILPDDFNGSRVIITTRLSNVAVYAGKQGFIHQLQFLNEDCSWALLHEKVFAQEHCPHELEIIGRLIARNCRGLPLAIVVVAGILSKVNKTRNVWSQIARDVCSATFDTNDEHFSKILSLSYNHLPHYLKPCFLYMGGFDIEISVSKLIKLWVAEGFLKPNESKNLEEVGEEYLEDLVNRSLVLITKKTLNGTFKRCIIHDLLRNLCKRRACDENFFHIFDITGNIYPKAIRNARRLYAYRGHSLSSSQKLARDSRIHSILCLRHHGNQFSFIGFKLLRILDALEIIFSSFPIQILNLWHLRYLALPESVFPIPTSISKLQNLQTLVIGSLPEWIYRNPLPSEVWKMPLLRHVIVCDLQMSPDLFQGDQHASTLENLQTLSRILNFSFTNRAIDLIPKLQKLKVFYNNDSCEKWQEYGLHNLVCLHQLETLDIHFHRECHPLMVDPFPNGFNFPITLKKLCLAGCRLPWKDMTVVGSLPNLQVLKLRLRAFVGEEWVPLEGEFPKLRYLEMVSINYLKYWRMENTHFPCLEQLVVKFCKGLREIPPGIGDIPTLELIEVYYNKLAADSAMRMQEDQRDLGNDILQVRVYSY